MKKSLLLVFILIHSTLTQAQTVIQVGSTPVAVDTVITGLDVPWEIIYKDGYLWTTERDGIVSRIDAVTGNKQVVLNLTSSVYQQSESGMLGMALHPDFPNTPEVFLAYTYLSSGNIRERIAKYTWNGTNLVNPVSLVQNIPGNTTHNGCRLFFLPDTTLLASTGDAQNTSYPQNTTAMNGKMLRMRTDGTAPVDNPIPGSLMYSFGHRNVQGIAMLPNDSIVLSEHGASSDDEVQFLRAGRNYGWPNVEGFCNTTSEINFCNANNVVVPILAYTPTIAPSDMMYYTNPNFPEWDSCMIMTVLKDKHVRALRMRAPYDTITTNTIYLSNLFGRLRDIAIGPNKEIYLATNGASWANTDPGTHSIIKLTPPNTSTEIGQTDSPVVFTAYPNPTEGHLVIEYASTQAGTGHTIAISNLLGQELLQQVALQPRTQLTLPEDCKPGVYLVKVTDNGSGLSSTSRIVLR